MRDDLGMTPFDHDLRWDDETPIDGLRAPVSPTIVATALRAGECPPDREFDRFFSAELQMVSSQYWTPLAVVVRLAEWLKTLGVRSVVDIGSGAGKLCVAGALASGCRFTGLEHRPRLVAAARALAQTFAVEDRVSFVHGAFGERAVPLADAYYLYNPFGENLFGRVEHLDEDVELGEPRYRRDVSAVECFLEEARVGTYLVTYNGFGGDVPPAYEGLYADWQTLSLLRVYRKNPL